MPYKICSNFSAGDYVKFGFPQAYATTMLAWGGIAWSRGYEDAGQLDYFKECIRWPADYFMAAHTNKFEFVGQVIAYGVRYSIEANISFV